MPRYVVLVNWTEQGIRNVKETLQRTDSRHPPSSNNAPPRINTRGKLTIKDSG